LPRKDGKGGAEGNGWLNDREQTNKTSRAMVGLESVEGQSSLWGQGKLTQRRV